MTLIWIADGPEFKPFTAERGDSDVSLISDFAANRLGLGRQVYRSGSKIELRWFVKDQPDRSSHIRVFRVVPRGSIDVDVVIGNRASPDIYTELEVDSDSPNDSEWHSNTRTSRGPILRERNLG